MILRILPYSMLLFSISPVVFALPSAVYDVNCGSNALMGICGELSVNTTKKEIQELSWFDPEAGTTMLGLVRAANKLKLPAVPLKLKYEEFRKVGKPGIVYLQGNHFSIVWKLSKNSAVLQDWPNPRREIARKEFESIWRGEVIVFSKFLRLLKRKEIASLFAPSPGPRIMFPLKVKDMGEVLEGTEISHIFTFVNIGSKPLTISARSNCSCTAAVLSEKEIAPGKQGKIKVSFNTIGRTGNQLNSVNILSNDPDNRLTTLSLRALVKASIKAVPSRLWIDRVTPGSAIKKEFEVYAPGDTMFAITEIRAGDGIRVVRQKEKKEDGNVSIPFSVTVNPRGSIGKYSKSIKLITNRPNVTIEIPIEGEIVGPLESFPPVAFLGQISHSTQFEQKLALRPVAGTVALKPSDLIVKSSVKGAAAINAVLEEKEGELELLIRGTTDPKSEIVEGSIDIVNSKSEKVLSIPVYGMVKR